MITESFAFCFTRGPDLCCCARKINFSNVNLIRDLNEYCNSKNLPLAIINLDQGKAFDRVNWNFLDRVLNFRPGFRKWIRIIYSEISFACLHSGFVTSFFEISHGARQGDPCPPCCIHWFAEVLGAAMRNCKDIIGGGGSPVSFIRGI